MLTEKHRIGIVAPASRIDERTAGKVQAVARESFGERVELVFHPQCFLSWGHFAGEDNVRADAFLEVANDETFDALWWARGGYGANRIAENVLTQLNEGAKSKLYLGYSDAGFLLAGLYNRGFRVAHGPVVRDIEREDGVAAVKRSLRFLTGTPAQGDLEPSVNEGRPLAAFNLTILSHLIGTPLEPDLSDHILLIEDVSEPMYAVDRALFHITSGLNIRRVAGLKLGRVSDVSPNDPDFAQTEEQVVRHWCATSGIPYLGRADIGHDTDNKIVPFGKWNG
ncbi:MAG TPA: LD-carboxypeptidase [Rhizomicrobium sp.]|jgi:muramoyltetrapeptide carboxypeptidase|nr:LD-carboxypeptidase [Rhizomicrobium sp.]